MRVHLFTFWDIVGGTWTAGLDSIATLPALVHSVAAEQGQDGSGLSPSKIDLKLIYWHILAMKWKWIYVSTCQFNSGCFQKRICVSILRRHPSAERRTDRKDKSCTGQKMLRLGHPVSYFRILINWTAEAFGIKRHGIAAETMETNMAFPGTYEHRLHHSPGWAAGDIFGWTSCVYRL